MNRTLRTMTASLALGLAALGATSARADDSLYQAWGRQDGIRAVVDDLLNRATTDARIAHFFQKTDREHLARQLTDQLCEQAGGPCRYQGPSMAVAHEDMGVRRADFHALVELLQQSMAAKGIPFVDQNRMLARLAPMHRDIVEP